MQHEGARRMQVEGWAGLEAATAIELATCCLELCFIVVFVQVAFDGSR